jgi:hypothetical protein
MTKSVNQLVASKLFHHFIVGVMARLRRKWSADSRQLAHQETMKEIAA